MNNKKFIYRLVLSIVCVIATITSFTDRIADGRPFALFFTAWSVWLATVAAIWTLIVTIKKEDESKALMVVKFSANIMIIATFIVSAFVLPNKIWMGSYWTFGSIFKHFLTPVLTVVDSCLFDKAKSFKAWHPFAGVVAPLLYWIIVVIRIVSHRNSMGGMIPEAEWDAYYPYGFTNFDNGHTLGGLIGLLAGILVGLIIIGYVFVLVNNKRKAK